MKEAYDPEVVVRTKWDTDETTISLISAPQIQARMSDPRRRPMLSRLAVSGSAPRSDRLLRVLGVRVGRALVEVLQAGPGSGRR